MKKGEAYTVYLTSEFGEDNLVKKSHKCFLDIFTATLVSVFSVLRLKLMLILSGARCHNWSGFCSFKSGISI